MSKVKRPKSEPPKFRIEGLFIRQTFVREYKERGHTEEQAMLLLESYIKSGEVEVMHEWGDTYPIPIYKFK